MARVTLKMLSARTGLAVSTISEILNGKPNFCSQDTREFVLQIARELGYVPNHGFKLMTGRDTGTAAILYSQRRISFEEHNRALAMTLLEMLNQLKRSAYAVVLSIDPQENVQRIRELISRGCREFFFLGAPMGDKEIYALLDQEKFKRSHFNSYGAVTNSIIIDYPYITGTFIDTFISRGITPYCLYTARHFERYARSEFLKRGLDPEKYFIEVDDLGHIQQDCFMLAYERTRTAIRNNLHRLHGTNGWICMSDCDAMGALAILNELNMPFNELGLPLVCGFGNSSYSRLLVQAINNVDLNLDKVAKLMLSQNSGQTVYKPEIILNKGDTPQ